MNHAYLRLGEEKLRTIVDDFMNRVTSDLMIGFFFANVDLKTLKQREFELAARMLGASIPYTGRPLREAHRSHPIMGGHFDRRSQILRNVLADHDVPEDIRQRWLEHVEALRSQITGQQSGQCD
jgi:hemoglobin